MKKILAILLILFSLSGISQTDNVENIKMVNDHLFLYFFTNNWLNSPKGLEIKPQSISTDVYWMLAPIGRKSIVSLNIGYGFSAQGIKSNGILYQDSLKRSFFNTEMLDTIKYRNNKFATVFFDIPIELRIRTRPNLKHKNLKLALGFKAGVLIQSYIKYFGDEYRFFGIEDEVKFKTYRVDNVLPYRYGVYGRLGYGKFYLFGYYSLSKVFEAKKGPDLTPINLGIGLSIYRSKTY